MEIRIQVIIDDDERTRRDIAHWDRPSLRSETLGLQLDEARALLQASQEAGLPLRVMAESTSLCGARLQENGYTPMSEAVRRYVRYRTEHLCKVGSTSVLRL